MSSAASKKAPLMAHLLELKRRVLWAMLAWLAGIAVCFFFAPEIYRVLVLPLAEAFGNDTGRRMIYTGLTETFMVYFKIALYAGFALAFPIIAAQLYLFLAPGLYKHEKRVFVPYLLGAPMLFAAGASLAYFFVMPLAWKFFLSFEQLPADSAVPLMLEARISEYISLVVQFMMAFGIAFQLPILMTLLVRAGMIKTATLARKRRLAVVILLVAAAILTPPDILSQLLLFLPLYLLYECSLLVCANIEKKHSAAQEWAHEHARH